MIQKVKYINQGFARKEHLNIHVISHSGVLNEQASSDHEGSFKTQRKKFTNRHHLTYDGLKVYKHRNKPFVT